MTEPCLPKRLYNGRDFDEWLGKIIAIENCWQFGPCSAEHEWYLFFVDTTKKHQDSLQVVVQMPRDDHDPSFSREELCAPSKSWKRYIKESVLCTICMDGQRIELLRKIDDDNREYFEPSKEE